MNTPLFDKVFAGEPKPSPPPLTGEALKISGMKSVARHTPKWYRDAFRKAVESLPAGKKFTVEDVREIAGDPPTSEVSSNCMGSLMRGVGQRGLAKTTGYMVKAKRPSLHSSLLAEWERL